MVRKLSRVSLAVALGAAVAALSVGAANSADEKVPPIKDIMRAGHKGDGALTARIGQAAKSGNWADAQKYAKKLAEDGAGLAKNTPKRGDPKSWEALATKYAANTKAVYEATEKKDPQATKSAIGTIGASCKTCHTAHKGGKK